MEDVKYVSKSVSMPEALWETVDGHAAASADGDRSTYIRRLVSQDLRAVGKLPGTDEAEARKAFDLLLEMEPTIASKVVHDALKVYCADRAPAEVSP